MSTQATALYQFDEIAVSRGRYWHWFKTPWLCWLLPVVGLFFIAVSIIILASEEDVMPTPWVLFGVGIYFVLRYWIMGIRFRREVRKSPQYGKMIAWTFSEEGFTAQTEGVEIKSKWSGLEQSYITPDGFLLYPRKVIYYWIPRASFGSADSTAAVEDFLANYT